MVISILKYTAIVISSIFTILILGFAFGSGRPIRTILLNSSVGLGSMALLGLTSFFTHIYVPLNIATLLSAGIFGLPAVCSLLFLNLIFGVF